MKIIVNWICYTQPVHLFLNYYQQPSKRLVCILRTLCVCRSFNLLFYQQSKHEHCYKLLIGYKRVCQTMHKPSLWMRLRNYAAASCLRALLFATTKKLEFILTTSLCCYLYTYLLVNRKKSINIRTIQLKLECLRLILH